MQKHPSCSFHSSSSDIDRSLQSSKEQSILNQYRKMQQNSQTHQYSQESLPYSQLPKFVNQQLKKSFSQCIYLDRFTFYQMFTMLIVQYLFKAPTQIKIKKINHFRSLVCSPQFLQGSVFTKGLIIKGLRLIEQISNSKQIIHPLGQCLLNCDSICAFTECWKQLIMKICRENNIPIMPQSQIDSSIFQLFASYFHVKFDVYWKQKGNKLWKQHFTFENAPQDADTLVVIVNPDYQISVSQRAIKISQSRASGNSSLSMTKSNAWNYLILTNPPPIMTFKKNIRQQNISEKNLKLSQKEQLPNGQQISRISEIDYSCGQTQQIKILLQQKLPQRSQTAKKIGRMRQNNPPAQQCLSTILNTMSKANFLIEDMKKYLEHLESIQVPNFQIDKQIFTSI